MSITYRVLLVSFVFFALMPRAAAQSPEPWMMGAGAAWLDCDNDGDLDLVFLKGQGNVFMFLNQNGHFVDASESIPLSVRNNDRRPSIALGWGDLNNDGWVDVVIGKAGRGEDGGVGRNVLLLNNGDNTFRDATPGSGMALEHFSSGIAPIDYNNDGLLDLFIINYRGQPNYLYRNNGVETNGDVRFTNVANDAGVEWPEDYPNTDAGTAALGVAVADYNNDGYADIYVANDFELNYEEHTLLPAPNQLYKNNGDGTFTDVSSQSGADEGGHAMGTLFADYNNDGWMDIFVANFWEDALLENNQDGTFTDVTIEKGVILDVPGEWHNNGWGTALFDYDNDGDLDLHVANGFIINGVGQITYEPDQMWENLGAASDYHFVDMSAKAGIDQTGDSRGVAYGDFNRDGFVDFFLVNTNFILEPGVDPGPARLLYKNLQNGTFKDIAYAEGLRDDNLDAKPPNGRKNFSLNKWIEIRPLGAFDVDTYPQGAPRTPIGTRITVTAGGKTWIQDMGSSSYGSQNSPYLHFGLGHVSQINEVRLRFPNGALQVFTPPEIQPNSILTVHELNGITEVVPVRLFGFEINNQGAAVELSWSYDDDNDLAAFYVEREALVGNRELLEAGIQGVGGTGSYTDQNPIAGHEVTYYLGAVMRNGDRILLGSQTHRFDRFSGLRLRAPRPNPFAEGTGIPVSAPRAGNVEVDILDISGRLVRQISQVIGSGETLLQWNGLDQRGMPTPAGVYYARLRDRQAPAVKLIKMP